MLRLAADSGDFLAFLSLRHAISNAGYGFNKYSSRVGGI
jgi:hypothetical protein